MASFSAEAQGRAAAELAASLSDWTRPTFLFGCTPPGEGTDDAKAALIAQKFADRGRVLAVDGYIVYDVQDESVRTDTRRPFPYRKLVEPSGFASQLGNASHKGCVVYKAVTNMASPAAFEEWLDMAVKQHGHRAINVVGAPSARANHTGPSTKEASAMVAGRNGVHFGAVCIAERHLSKRNEHSVLAKKASWGAEWFITQGIYDPEPTIDVILAYAAQCEAEGTRPRKIILTFTPCGRRKTLEFIKWLGMHVPQAVEDRIFADQTEVKRPMTAVALSCALLCEHLQTILARTKGCGVPLGINVESVSGYRDEIDSTHDLFRSLQAILLDELCASWVIHWSRLPKVAAAASACSDAAAKDCGLSDQTRRVYALVSDSPSRLVVVVGLAALAGFALGRA
mmetsp:Transcript_11699/g.37514  ORF Transcript_11699/g.37514 Transcript_11699/m.37514 type:complete len:398 (-) Transcript_11699:199-1392(-)